jgi:hypothetical protein
MNETQQKTAEDVSARSHKMPRNSTLLFRNRSPKNAASSHYRGLLKLENGDAFWCALWVRRIDQERVLEIKLSPKIS